MDAATEDIVERLTVVLAARDEILDAYLFGSTARGDGAAHSDVDVAVYVDRGRMAALGPFGWDAELLSDLMAALGRNEVDLVVLNDAPPVLYHRVIRDGIRLVSRDPRATTTREGRALSRYFDYLPQLAKIERARRTPGQP